MHWFCQHLSI